MESLTIQKFEKLSEKGKMMLDARWEEHRNNKDKAKPWSEFKKKLKLNGKFLFSNATNNNLHKSN